MDKEVGEIITPYLNKHRKSSLSLDLLDGNKKR